MGYRTSRLTISSQYLIIHRNPEQNKSILPCQNSGLQLPRMPLQLIPMRIHTSKEICPTMHIEHDSLHRIVSSAPLLEIRPHLNPLGLQIAARPPPLPPRLSPHHFNPMGPQLGPYRIRGGREMFPRDGDMVQLHPVRTGNPLRGEALDVFHCVVRRVEQEFPDQVKTLVVRDVRRGFQGVALAIEILHGISALVASGMLPINLRAIRMSGSQQASPHPRRWLY
jgi:hypothetical protein